VQKLYKMNLKLASPTLTSASVFRFILVAPSTSHQIAESVNFAKDPTDAAPHGFDCGGPANKGQECSVIKSFKVRGTSDFGCEEDEYCVEDPMSSLGGRCINLDVEQEQDFDTTLAVESHRWLEGIPCYYSDGSEGVKCEGEDACYYNCRQKWMIDPDKVGCDSCNGDYACYYSTDENDITIGENSCVGNWSCSYGEFEEVY
jgi:hypothetical protein